MLKDTRTITLSQGKVAIVDASDFDWLSQWKWIADRRPHGFYVSRKEVGAGPNSRNIYMHRFIMLEPKGMMVDHVNHDPLDNRRANLRICTRTENLRNRTSLVGSSSKYLGVSWQAQSRKWQAHIRWNGKSRYLGLYANEDDAARAYDAAAREHFGEFANPHFPS